MGSHAPAWSDGAAKRRRGAAVHATQQRGDGQGPQGKKHRPQHKFSWRDHVHKFTAAEFKKRYRLDFNQAAW